MMVNHKGTNRHEVFQRYCHYCMVSADDYGNDSASSFQLYASTTHFQRFALTTLRGLSELTDVGPDTFELMSLMPLYNAYTCQDQRTSLNYVIFWINELLPCCFLRCSTLIAEQHWAFSSLCTGHGFVHRTGWRKCH